MRGIAIDSAYVASLISWIPSPRRRPLVEEFASWAVVATGDKAAGADVVRSMAQRAKATINEVEGSHMIMISQLQAVTDVILTALATVS